MYVCVAISEEALSFREISPAATSALIRSVRQWDVLVALSLTLMAFCCLLCMFVAISEDALSIREISPAATSALIRSVRQCDVLVALSLTLKGHFYFIPVYATVSDKSS